MDKQSRISSIDTLRGLLIAVMALDHANFFIAQQHSLGEYWGGKFPSYTAVLPFITRLVTHIAAPGFFLLMGLSAWPYWLPTAPNKAGRAGRSPATFGCAACC